jgi:hypothetical protein
MLYSCLRTNEDPMLCETEKEKEAGKPWISEEMSRTYEMTRSIREVGDT